MCRRICCSVDERGRGGSFFDSAIIITSVSAILCGDDAQAIGIGAAQAAKLKSVLLLDMNLPAGIWTRYLRTLGTVYRRYLALFVSFVSQHTHFRFQIYRRDVYSDVRYLRGTRNRRHPRAVASLTSLNRFEMSGFDLTTGEGSDTARNEIFAMIYTFMIHKR